MRKSFFVLLVLVLVACAFISCKNEPEEKTVAGTWINHYSEDGYVVDSTLVLGKDGSATLTSSGSDTEDGITTQMSGEMTGTYTTTSDTEGTIVFTSGTATITIGGVSETETMPSSMTYTFTWDGADTLVYDGDEYTRK